MLEKIEARCLQLAQEREAKDLIEAKLKAMQSKLLTGGGNLIDQTRQQQELLQQRHIELAEQKVLNTTNSLNTLAFCRKRNVKSDNSWNCKTRTRRGSKRLITICNKKWRLKQGSLRNLSQSSSNSAQKFKRTWKSTRKNVNNLSPQLVT